MINARVGFIGLGNMGGRITRRLVNAGIDVLGFDINPRAIAESGARAATSTAEVVRQSDIVLLSLPDSRVIEAVTLGPDGIVANSRSGQVVVDLSTAAPESTRKLCAIYAERGVQYLDAGISGGAAAAEKGTLTLMVGGSSEALETVRPIFEHFASRIYFLGSSGNGHITKLLNNFLNAVALAATAEAMIAARKAGLDLATVLDVFNNGSGVNFATMNRFPKIIKGDYLKGGLTNTLMLKDVTLYVELLSELGIASLNAAGPVASFGLACALGYADKISNSVVDALGDISGGIRLSNPVGEEDTK